MRTLEREEFKKILLIKMSSMGDVVHALPTLCALRERFPRATIAWLVDERYGALVGGHPALDVAIVARAPNLPFSLPLAHLLRASLQYAVVGELRRWNFDLVLDLQGLFRTGLLAAATGARMRVGFAVAREAASIFYTHCVAAPPDGHAVERYLSIARSLGASGGPIRFGMQTSRAADDAAGRLRRQVGLIAGEPYAVIAPRSSHRKKDWRPDGFAAVARALWDRWRLPSLLIGGKQDSPTCRWIAAESQVRVVPLVGQSLDVSAALIASCQLVVANDSGPLHLAVALGRPVVGIFGPTDPAQTGPWGRADSVVQSNGSCALCQLKLSGQNSFIARLGTARHTCLSELPADPVIAKVEQVVPKYTLNDEMVGSGLRCRSSAPHASPVRINFQVRRSVRVATDPQN